MANYFFNHARNANNIDKWFKDHSFTRIQDTSDINHSVYLKTGDLVFVHASDYSFWVELALSNQEIDFVFMSRDSKLRKDEKWPGNIHICRYPADELGKYDRVKCFFKGLSSGKRLWNFLSFDLKTNLTALSILCQGYLAVHGDERFKISDNLLQQKAEKNKDTTELLNWWVPVLGKANGIDKELETIVNKSGIIPLVKIIKNKPLENGIVYFKEETLIPAREVEFTKIVNETYEKLSKILEGSF